MIVLYTHMFPYGKGETFLEAEIKVLADNNESILIIPLKPDGNKRALPLNVEVLNYKEERKSNIWFLGQFFKFFDVSLITFEKQNLYKLKHLMIKAWNIAQAFPVNKSIVHYSYWLDDGVIVAAFVKRWLKCGVIIARAHGFDIYAERRENGKVPFKIFQLKNVEKVFSVSDRGAKYLQKKFPKFDFKVDVERLGVYEQELAPIPTEKVITILSVSNIVPIKRLELVVKFLKAINNEVNWIHFGDGSEMLMLKEQLKTLPKTCNVLLKGRVENFEVLEFMRENPVDLIINTSSSEGVPVSLMEAAHFGIPLLATDVGGTKEIVNERTGALLLATYNEKEWLGCWNTIISEFSRNKQKRNQIRAFAQANYNALINYKDWSRILNSEVN